MALWPWPAACVFSGRSGGYWPGQYQLPGLSQSLLAGSASHALDFLLTFLTCEGARAKIQSCALFSSFRNLTL